MSKESVGCGLFPVIAIIVSTLVYLGLGWIVADIYFSIADVGKMTPKDVIHTRIWIYNIIAALYVLILLLILEEMGELPFESDLSSGIILFAPIVLAFVINNWIPFSNGAILLNIIVCILDMSFVSWFFLGAWLLD